MSAEELETEAGAANDATEVVDDDRVREAAGGLGGWCRTGSFARRGEIGQNRHRQNGR